MEELHLSTQHARVSDTELSNVAEQAAPYVEQLRDVAAQDDYKQAESSIRLPADSELLRESAELRDKLASPALKCILVVGIGGSNLGTKAVYDALLGHFDPYLPDRRPRLLFLDTNDPETTEKMLDLLELTISAPEELLIQGISKSGGTTETIANLELVFSRLSQKIGGLDERFVVVSDEGSKFWQLAKDRGWQRLPIPASVGGRFSVLSPVGIFPLLACGSDAPSLLNGAFCMRERCLSPDHTKNPALLGAAALYVNYKKGCIINDNFFFHTELESLGKWYRQLMGESLGKEHDLAGKQVNLGITPTVSIGSIDLHSVAQLYIGGPRDKFTSFLTAGSHANVDLTVPDEPLFPGLVSGIQGRSSSDIMKAIFGGTRTAYAKRGLPFYEIHLPLINEFHIGEYLQFKMIEIMLIGNLLNVNTFDQPAVEEYKVEMKNILNG